jgi:beta-phosphoglucomutase
MLQAALWDMDGTLVDTGELHFEAWVASCRKYGRDFTRQDFADTFGRRNPEIMRFLFGDRFSMAEMDAIATEKEELYLVEARKGITLLPGVLALIEAFAAVGVKQAIGSSAPRKNLDVIIEYTSIAKFMAATVGMEDTQNGKPDPEVFLRGAQALGVSPENCVVFEDAIAGVQAAKAAGMKCVAVTFVGHHSAEKLAAAGADLIVPRLDAISLADVQKLFT